MIVFDLACANGHAFEGWFASGAEFDRQKAAHLVTCPMCDGSDVERRPSSKVRIGKPRAMAPTAPPSGREVIAGLPAEVLAKLREVVRNTEDVGERFPEEARKIHYDEAVARPIRGQASREEAESLSEEGIDFSQLPSILTRDSH
jgi:hypothetical protein